jgi:hypothetical protein
MTTQGQNPALIPEERPRFIIDERATDTHVVRRLRLLERRINNNPVEFQSALEALGEAATQSALSLSELEKRESTLKSEPEELLTEHFSQRHDYEISYDNATEKSLKADSAHEKLMQTQSSKRTIRIKGKAYANPEAISATNAVRRNRMKMYIGRTVAWQARDNTRDVRKRSSLPRTG